ncbi:MAG: T9SS type A sorting domain-containing protein, partial [Bacteroidales bacterium]
NLTPGHNYLWLAYDVALDATHRNTLDAMIPANQIVTSNGTFPEADLSPVGSRIIHQTRYYDDFEGSLKWALTGEFEVGSPSGGGGNPGNPDPARAHSGTHALGTDLTGLGSNPYNYEPDLSDANADKATTENINLLYYRDLNLFFWRHLNIEVWDQASIEISTDSGATWEPLWESNAYINDFTWNQEKVAIPSQYWRSEGVRFRFSLGPTDGVENYSGWNIDDVYLTGEYITKDVGVSAWIYPQSGSGHTSSDSVTVRIRNFGGEDITDPVPVAYSFNGGSTWTINQMQTDIPVDGWVEFTFPSRVDLSQPGLRPQVLAKTLLPGDQFAQNDQISTEVYIVPTFFPPYLEDFEENDGYWRTRTSGLWEFGTPAGTVINGAASGSQGWATGLSSTYGSIISDRGEIIFEDGFESNLGWSFSGEFERAIPDGIHLPWYAYSGYYCIGTDLKGQGDSLNLYENGITPAFAYTATSPVLDVSNYSNLELNFAGWVTVQEGDSIRVEVSDDNGSTWHTIWQNNGEEIQDAWYQQVLYEIPDEFTFTEEFRFRYSLYYTSPSGAVAQGWSIDNILLSGDLNHTKEGMLTSPSFNLTGMQHPMIAANLWVESEEGTDGANLEYSLDDGINWTAITNTSGFDTYWNWYTGQPVTALANNGWSGHSGQWIPVKHLLPASLAGETNVQFRILFAADKADNEYDGIAVDDVRVLEAPPDADLLAIVNPVSSCELSSTQQFTLSVRNSGLTTITAGDSIRIGYVVEHPEEIQTAEEVYYFTQNLNVGSTMNVTTGSKFDFGRSGEYLATVYLQNPEPHFYAAISADTVSSYILVQKPQVDLGELISTSRPDTVVLRAYSGVSGQTYLWQDGSTDSLFHVSSEGLYYVTATNGLGCQARDTVEVMQLVPDVGIGSVVGPLSDCELGDQLPLEIIIQNFGTDTVDVGDTIYISGKINNGAPFGEALVMSQRFTPGQSMPYTFPGLYDFSVPGAYQLKLYTSMSNDMVGANDTLNHLLEVYGYPDSDLGPDTVVIAADYLLEPGSGYADYLWQDGSTGERFLVTKPGSGLYHVRITDTHQCSSADSVVVTLKVMDLALVELLSPATSCELSESITVSARFRNVGNQSIPSGESVQLGYRIDSGPVQLDQVTLAQNLLPGHSIDFTFSQTETVQTGQWYDFTVFVDYASDSKSFNDTVLQSVGVFETPALDLGENFQVVTELQHTLDAGPGFAWYEWQDGSSEQTFTITKTGVGRYWVTVMDINGCSVSDTVDVMLAVPDVGILEVSDPVTTCHLEENEHVTVAVRNFGNWDIEPGAGIDVAYSLNGAEAVVESLVLDRTFEPGTILYHTFEKAEDFSTPGLYEIMAYTVFDNDLVPTNDFFLASVDHYGSPVIDIGQGADTLVVYEPMTLSATQGYPSYLWQDGSTDTVYHITEPSQGMYSVLVTGENGCATHDSVYVAYDVPDLKLSGMISPVNACSMDGVSPVTLEITNQGYFRIGTSDTLTFSYSVDGGSSVIEKIQLDRDLLQGESTTVTFTTGHDFSATGSYEIQASALWSKDENLSNNLLTQTVNIWGIPDVEIAGVGDSVITDLPLILNATPGFAAYIWQDLSMGGSYEVTEPGLCWVMATDGHGCTDTDSVYVDSETAVEEPVFTAGQVSIYPNPASERVYLQFEPPVESSVRLELFTMSRSLVLRKEVKHPLITEAQLEVQHLVPGTYLLRITADGVPYHYKVIVE